MFKVWVVFSLWTIKLFSSPTSPFFIYKMLYDVHLSVLSYFNQAWYQLLHIGAYAHILLLLGSGWYKIVMHIAFQCMFHRVNSIFINFVTCCNVNKVIPKMCPNLMKLPLYVSIYGILLFLLDIFSWMLMNDF